jgi:D-threonine aldolase
MRPRTSDIPTLALIADAAVLSANIATMAAARPGARLRPHVKAHKCTALARRQAAAGHAGFTCATIRECEGMAAAGLGTDLLLANEVLDARRLGVLTARGARVTVAVDSPQTIEAAAAGGVRKVVIDINVGLRRCGCPPGEAGRLTELAASRGLAVRGVMGYEGHVVRLADAGQREERCRAAMELLVAAHAETGGELISAGGTGTYACNIWASEIQAGSYVLMDSAYGALGLPFGQALFVLPTVVPSAAQWSVAEGRCPSACDDPERLVDVAGTRTWLRLRHQVAQFTETDQVAQGHAEARFRRSADPLKPRKCPVVHDPELAGIPGAQHYRRDGHHCAEPRQAL